MTRLKVTCDKCEREVDCIEVTEDFRTYGLIFIATCHGQTESCRVDKFIMQEILAGNFEARAFTIKEITCPIMPTPINLMPVTL